MTRIEIFVTHHLTLGNRDATMLSDAEGQPEASSSQTEGRFRSNRPPPLVPARREGTTAPALKQLSVERGESGDERRLEINLNLQIWSLKHGTSANGSPAVRVGREANYIDRVLT